MRRDNGSASTGPSEFLENHKSINRKSSARIMTGLFSLERVDPNHLFGPRFWGLYCITVLERLDGAT